MEISPVTVKQEAQTVPALRQPMSSAQSGVQVLHQAATRFAEMRRGSPFRTRELVSLLLGHAARTWRASLPPAAIGLRVRSPDGNMAVRIRLP